jgi:hypothetical protein
MMIKLVYAALIPTVPVIVARLARAGPKSSMSSIDSNSASVTRARWTRLSTVPTAQPQISSASL